VHSHHFTPQQETHQWDVLFGVPTSEGPLRLVGMGAAVSYLSKLDAVQKKAEKLSDCTFPSLHSHREASAVGLFCKVLDFRGRGPLQQFCPAFATTPLTHSYSL